MSGKIFIGLFAIMLFALMPIVYAYDTEDLIRETLAPAGVDVIGIGVTNEGAFVKYEQRATSSPANVHASQIMALSVLADEFPETDYVFAFMYVGEKPITVAYAETSDVLAFNSGSMSASEFSTKVYVNVLAPESEENEEKQEQFCCPGMILITALLGVTIARASFNRR
ncbi:MAG: hypothetical protein ABIH99_01080 [Candidatus Micrarchaeota archaeon]